MCSWQQVYCLPDFDFSGGKMSRKVRPEKGGGGVSAKKVTEDGISSSSSRPAAEMANVIIIK